MNRWRGFTLVELVVVIAVIAILATLATLGLSRYLADGRDTRRAANAAVITEALEKYYDAKGEYPSCSALTGSASDVATNVLKGIDQAALRTPAAASATDNSLECGTVLTASGEDFYEFVGDGSVDCNTNGSCLSFKLRYKSEAEGTIKELSSRRATDFATSGVPSLTLGEVQATSVALSWTPVSNATGYRIQKATTSNFSTNMTEQTVTTNAVTVENLNTTTLYYFRVLAVGGSSTSQWSNTVNATTLSIGTPTLTSCAINSASQITISWAAASGAQTYNLQRSTSSSFTSPTTVTGITGTSQVVTGLPTGTLYYFRVQAVSGSATGAFSGATYTCGATTVPSNVAAISNSCESAALTWTASTGATSYNIEFSTSASFTSPTTQTGFTGTSGTVTGLSQGSTIYFRMYALVGSGVTAASTATNATPVQCPPPAYNVSCTNNGATITCTSQAICSPGATPNYYWYVNNNPYQQGTNLKNFSYTPGYDQVVSVKVNTQCGGSAWVGSSNSGSFTRGIPAPGTPTWIQHVVSNNVNMYWYGVGCAAGYPVYHVWIVRRSNGAVYFDTYTTDTTTRRGSLPVASWDSYVQAYCQGANSSSGWGGAALGQAG